MRYLSLPMNDSVQFCTYERVADRCTAIHWKHLASFAWGKLMSGKYYGRLIETENDLQCAIEAIGDEYVKTNGMKTNGGWYDPEEDEMTIEVTLGPKVFECPSCHALWRISPKYSWGGRYWDYEGKCENCKTTWVNRFHAMRKPLPGEKLSVVKEIRNQSADP